MLEKIKKMEGQLGFDIMNLKGLTGYGRELQIRKAVGEFVDKSAENALPVFDTNGRITVLENAVNAKILADKEIIAKATEGSSKVEKAETSPAPTTEKLEVKHAGFVQELKDSTALIRDARRRAASKETETPQPASSFDKNPLVADAQRRAEVNDLENRKEQNHV